MTQLRFLTIADQRAVTPRLRWLTLLAPDLARGVRPGQYLLVRCAEAGSYDPLLRRPLFVAAAEPALGQIALLYGPSEPGLAWLARGRSGDTLDVLGPFGQPFAIERGTRNLLLIGAGAGLAALLLLAQQGAARGCAITLVAGASAADALPPPFLLPGEIEYQTTVGAATDLLAGQPPAPQDKETARQGDVATGRRGVKAKRQKQNAASSPSLPATLSPVSWADQICAALPSDQLAALTAAVRTAKYRWDRGFASALLEGPLVCGVGACGVCAVELRRGTRMLCADGPVFDLRDIARNT
jgi:dihydroorotate dehydrogenase electron transfer subunit